MKRNFFAFCCLGMCALLFGEAGIVPPAGWTCTGYQYNMTFYAQVQRTDGTMVDDAQSVLAVFDDYGNCRGTISSIEGPAGRLFSLLVCSDSIIEKGLTLRMLDAATGEIFHIEETIDFASDACLPSEDITRPMTLHLRAPYVAFAEINVAFNDGSSERLCLGTDIAASDDYSSSKDTLTLSERAYVLGKMASGIEVKLRESIHGDEVATQWEVVVTVAAGGSATLNWSAATVNNRQMYLQPSGETASAFLLNESGEYVLSNSSNQPCSYHLKVFCGMESTLGIWRMRPGWNLVTMSCVPTPAAEAEILALKPYTMKDGSYVLATSLGKGAVVWCWSAEKQIYLFGLAEPSSHGTFATWQLLDGAAVPDDCQGYGWSGGIFRSVWDFVAGIGYWVRVN